MAKRGSGQERESEAAYLEGSMKGLKEKYESTCTEMEQLKKAMASAVEQISQLKVSALCVIVCYLKKVISSNRPRRKPFSRIWMRSSRQFWTKSAATASR